MYSFVCFKRALDAKADKIELNEANLRIMQNKEAIALMKPVNIEALQTKAMKLEASISKLNDQVQHNTLRIEKLSEELKRGLETQSALSGLFQPYNIGKVNVTAAVGGYKSKSAIAVGAGYRLNTKFSAKAGIALGIGDRNSAAYNVGVNYEF